MERSHSSYQSRDIVGTHTNCLMLRANIVHECFKDFILINVSDMLITYTCCLYQGKLVFGNYNVPTTLSVNFGEAHIMYTTKPASTPFDLFMHIIKCRAERLKVMFVNSPKYTGPVDE